MSYYYPYYSYLLPHLDTLPLLRLRTHSEDPELRLKLLPQESTLSLP